MTTKSRVGLRIINQMNEKIRGIMALLGLEGVSEESPFKLRLRTWQIVVSVCHMVILRAAEQMNIAGAVREQFRSEVKRLEESGYHTALGNKTTEEFEQGVLARLEKSVEDFFRQPKYHVGKSQRYVSFVFNEIPWKVQLEKLALALGRPASAGQLSVVGGVQSAERSIAVVFEEGFEERYDATRKLHSYPQVDSSVYVLCGVTGGRDTDEWSAERSLAYFKERNRIPLTLKGATTLYTNHPDFLANGNANVVLLGEQCADTHGGKFVTLCFDEAEGKLHVGLASLGEVDRAYQPSSIAPHAFHGGSVSKRYGKPSAGAIILP